MSDNKLWSVSDTIISIVTNFDCFEPYVYNRGFVLGLISEEDAEFYKKIKDRLDISFSFGDKYFHPVNNDTQFLCIPLKVVNLREWLIKNISGDIDYIIEDFKKMTPKMKESGTFVLLPY